MNKSTPDIEMIASAMWTLLLVLILSCSNSNDNSRTSTFDKNTVSAGYNLSYPDKTIILPKILHEISGISVIDSSEVACIQDEKGVVFVFDLIRMEISKEIVFYSDGDYEGIACIKNTIFALRSDGTLFEVSDLKSHDLEKKIFPAGIPGNDYEALCYEQKRNRLLIVPKNRTGKKSESKDKRPVYGFDIKPEIFIKEPVFYFDISAVRKSVAELEVSKGEKDKKKKEKGEPQIEFSPSDIAIHPVTNKIYILSASERLLFVADSNGTVEFSEKLDPDIFNMPEGITFLKNGDMLISNEGGNKKPTLLRFNYK